VYYSVLDAKGLYTYANPLGQQSVPGAMSVALNVNCDQIGVATTRRGFDFYSSQKFTVTGGFITKMFVYENRLYASFNGGQFAQDNGSGTWSTYAGFTMKPPTGGFLHQMLAGGNSYFTTSNGIYKLSGINATAPIPAGAPAALDTVTVVSGTVASGFLNAQSQCAYSIVWGYTDQSNLQIVGAPSYAAFAANTQTAGANNNANVTLTITIPPFVRQNSVLPWFYQVYRTPNTGSLSVPPGNNYQMVAQLNPAAGDYTNGYVTYADTVLDSLLGASLYTDSGQPDVGNPYGQPPLAQDAAYFNSMAFYANYSTLQSVLLTLAAVGATQGIQSGDTITLTDSTSGTAYTYTGGASNNPTTRTFQVSTGGTPAVNIQTTAQNFVSVVNQDPNNLRFVAQYISGYSALPGQMQLFAQNLSQAFFSVTSSRTTCWTPTVPSSGTTYASSSVSVPNGLVVSQVSKPESCPPSFLVPVGSPNFPISRIIPVRTALIVVKPSEGVFQVTGSTPTTLTVTTLDTTAFISGSETMAALNNAGYFFTTQGVMLVNESGCEIMSRNVQGDILALASSQYPSFTSLAFGLGYQSDNAYILFLQQNPQDTYSTLQYRYNWITQAWTTWNIPCTAAVVNTADDRLYLATPDGHILQERKTFTSSDYADQTTTVTINAIGTNAFTLASSLTVNVGDQLSQINGGTHVTCTVTSNNPVTGVVGVSTTSGFVTGATSDVAAINSTVTFMPTNCGYPAFIKKFTTWSFEFSSIGFTQATASFTTDFYPTQESVTLMPKVADTWGTFPWGSEGWGVTTAVPQAISTYATKNTAMGHWIICTLQMQQAFTGFSLAGYGVFFNFLGERFR
jgi:hypothetical protein